MHADRLVNSREWAQVIGCTGAKMGCSYPHMPSQGPTHRRVEWREVAGVSHAVDQPPESVAGFDASQALGWSNGSCGA